MTYRVPKVRLQRVVVRDASIGGPTDLRVPPIRAEEGRLATPRGDQYFIDVAVARGVAPRDPRQGRYVLDPRVDGNLVDVRVAVQVPAPISHIGQTENVVAAELMFQGKVELRDSG